MSLVQNASSARGCRTPVKSGWGPCRHLGSSRLSFSFHHQLVDRFPFGIDGSLQFPRLAHGFVPSRQNWSVALFPCLPEAKGSPGNLPSRLQFHNLNLRLIHPPNDLLHFPVRFPQRPLQFRHPLLQVLGLEGLVK